ncbi:sugar ABC transporter substrate-binding protein [Paenibacillus sp. HWE-109]|uniref:ABC transporter substrate-binding protein n=1 Tax=Paenibacillus sp. HWE-109 TaxID=1306526 RepID=UPI001EE0DD74|nr:sugar ABC transporter substrate-binding protein [Paenibacillus sp. HWE-109]UKS28476.1 sugar ABC transporter substrate-binding protein [Paenibacillus sp. HWE-109]
MVQKRKYSAILIGSALIVQIITACSASPANTASTGTPAATGTSGNKADAAPTGEKVTLRVMDWADSEKPYREKFIKDFEAKYPNIKIEYTLMSVDQFQNTITTAIKSGDAPDLFPIPGNMSLSMAVKGEWYQPLDAYLDDAFKNQFIDGVFVEGSTVLNGKVYSIPALSSVPSTLVYYNKQLFRDAGLNPDNPPKTYTEFREAAKKITEAGKGKAYGIIEGGKQIGRWKLAAMDWSALGGSGLNQQSPISLATHDANYDSKAVVDVMNLFKGMKDDGSFHPKTMSISAPEARALFGEGQAGFILQGEWSIGVWKRDNPNLDFGVMMPPVPDDGQKGYLPKSTIGAWIGMSKTSKHPKEAALYLKEYFSKEYQSVLVKAGDRFSILKDVNESSSEIPQFKQYYDIVQKSSRLIPNPQIRNPELTSVYGNYKDVQPGVGDILQGVVSGAIKDPTAPLKQYSDLVNKALDTAIAKAKSEGAKVDKNDFVFSNWSQDKNYIEQDYKSIK